MLERIRSSQAVQLSIAELNLKLNCGSVALLCNGDGKNLFQVLATFLLGTSFCLRKTPLARATDPKIFMIKAVLKLFSKQREIQEMPWVMEGLAAASC